MSPSGSALAGDLPRGAVLGCALALASCVSAPAAPILNYHRIGASDPPLPSDVSPAAFARQLDRLVAAGYHTISLDDVVAHRNLDRAVALTFDDGTEDALTSVVPALRARGMRATFFVVTGFVGTPGYLTWEGVRALERAGMIVGSHTASHLRLPDADADRVRRELRGSKEVLERELGHPVALFAYPYNSMRRSLIGQVREAGYRIAVAGAVHGTGNPLRLRRIPVGGATTGDELLAALRQR